MSEPHWEKVYTVDDFYDGPRLGIADYHGQPHLYESRWDDSKDRWEGEGGEEDYVYHCWLSPVPPEVFALALEDWAIWLRWESAFHAGKTDESTHPALPEDRARHEQLKSPLEQALKPGQPGAFRMAGKFDVKLDVKLDELRVRWTRPQIQPAQQSPGSNDQG